MSSFFSSQRRKFLKQLAQASALGLTLPALPACVGENPPTVALPEYPDKGRTTIDPITPGLLSITFDDGPHPRFTRPIVDILNKHGVTALFFMMGKHIIGNRDVLDYVQTHKQQIGHHTFYHRPQPSLSEGVFKHRFNAVKENIGDRDNGRLLFRFPYGAAGDDQLRFIREMPYDGNVYRVVGWNLDSQDWNFGAKYPAKTFSAAILEDSAECGGVPNPFQEDYVGWCQFIARKKTGGVMLFHDIQEITRDHLDLILTYFKDPKAYWTSLPAVKRTIYEAYYACETVDPLLPLKILPIHSGPWPSYVDPA